MKIYTLLVFIFLCFSVQVADATTYLQVTNTSTIQASNTTAFYGFNDYTTDLQILSIPQNISGNFSINYFAKTTTYDAFIKVYKNGVAYSAEQKLTSSNATYVFSFLGVLNTSDILSIRGNSNGYLSGSLYSSNLTYDYVSAPTITSPLNNSASTDTTQNITWTGTAPHQYQVSTQSNFATLIHNNTTANAYSGNLMLPVGLNYIRVRGYNEGINETNWSATTQISIYTNYTVPDFISGYNTDSNSIDLNTTSVNDITLTGTIYNSSGVYGSAFEFDGADDIGTIATNNILNFSSNMSFSGWLKPHALGEVGGRIYDKTSSYVGYVGLDGTSGLYNYYFLVYTDTGLCQFNTTSGNILNNWTHVVMTYQQGNIRIYLNGVNNSYTLTSSGCGATISSTSNQLYIGNRLATDRTYDGLMDELRFYNRALTASEAQQIYNSSYYSYIDGYVLYPNGMGINNAEVYINNSIIYTDSNGYYSINNLPTDEYIIVAGATGYGANGTLADIYNSTRFNLTLSSFTASTPNVFLSNTSDMFNYFGNYINASGHLSNPEFDDGHLYYAEAEYGELGAVLYNQSINRSASLLYKTLMVLQHVNRDIIRANNSYGLINTTITSDSNHMEFHMVFFTKAIERLKPYVNASMWNDWNSTLNTFDTASYGATTCADASSRINNWCTIQANTEYFRYLNGNIDNTADVDNITRKYSEQINENGYFGYAEQIPVSAYSIFGVYWATELEKMGYVNQTYSDAINRSTNYTYKVQAMDGEWLTAGRSSGHAWNVGQAIAFSMLQDENKGDWYRRADLGYFKLKQYVYSNGTYYIVRNYYSPESRTGYMIYSSWAGYNLLTGYFLGRSGELYDPTTVENPIDNGNFQDFNSSASPANSQSNFLLLNYGNYSIYYNPLYYSNEIFRTYGNSTGSIPLRFIITRRDSMNITSYPNPDPQNDNNIVEYFNSGTYAINLSSINASNITYGISENSIWINTTGINTISGGGLIGYYNLSATIYDNDTVHIRRDIGDVTGITLTNWRARHWELINDNITTATVTISGANISYSRGAETLSITNVTQTNGIASAIAFPSPETSGLGQYGYYNASLIYGNIQSFPHTYEYDLQINTTNVYGYELNQPPGVASHSPETPVMDIVGASRTFTVTFTQNLDTITWYLNGTQIQQNTSVSIAGYTNTSAEEGSWNITAIASNPQGTAQQIWIWAVSNPPLSVYNTGRQYIMVNDTTTMNDYGALTGATWLANWNSTSQAFESHKVGWSYRQSLSLAKGAGVMARFATNKTIEMTMNESYNWTVATNYTLLGNEQVRTLGELNTSLNSLGTCQVTNITYINPITQAESVFTCGSVGNSSIEVPYGAGFWTFSTEAFDRGRT